MPSTLTSINSFRVESPKAFSHTLTSKPTHKISQYLVLLLRQKVHSRSRLQQQQPTHMYTDPHSVLIMTTRPGKNQGLSLVICLLLSVWSSHAFSPIPSRLITRWSSSSSPSSSSSTTTTSKTQLHLDLISYLRTEWISAALCTNQTPRSADVCLQLGTEDGRAVTFVPRTIRTLLTSSAEADGRLSVAAKRQLKQNEERRKAAKVKLIDQAADDLSETEDESVDVVISLQCAQRLVDNGRDWKASIREAARVLKPGGRLLWVEQTELKGEKYLDYIQNLYTKSAASGADAMVSQESSSTDSSSSGSSKAEAASKDAVDDEDDGLYPVFTDIGWDDVNLVLVPHTAGVAIKAVDPAVVATLEQQQEQDKMAELSMTAFERGLKKRKKKKKKKVSGE